MRLQFIVVGEGVPFARHEAQIVSALGGIENYHLNQISIKSWTSGEVTRIFDPLRGNTGSDSNNIDDVDHVVAVIMSQDLWMSPTSLATKIKLSELARQSGRTSPHYFVCGKDGILVYCTFDHTNIQRIP